MRRKLNKPALAMTLCVALIFVSCSSEPDLVMPNPGFGILALGVEIGGITHSLPSANTSGRIPTMPFTNQLIFPTAPQGP
jgi:hypothetical protein